MIAAKLALVGAQNNSNYTICRAELTDALGYSKDDIAEFEDEFEDLNPITVRLETSVASSAMALDLDDLSKQVIANTSRHQWIEPPLVGNTRLQLRDDFQRTKIEFHENDPLLDLCQRLQNVSTLLRSNGTLANHSISISSILQKFDEKSTFNEINPANVMRGLYMLFKTGDAKPVHDNLTLHQFCNQFILHLFDEKSFEDWLLVRQARMSEEMATTYVNDKQLLSGRRNEDWDFLRKFAILFFTGRWIKQLPYPTG